MAEAAPTSYADLLDHVLARVQTAAVRPFLALRVRLLARHRAGGRSPDEARAKIVRTDLHNARTIRAGKFAAGVVIDDARCL